LALTIALAGYQCRIARATAVELSLNDYRPFELPLAIPIGRLLLRGDLLEGQRDRFLPRDLRKIIRHRKLRFAALCLDHGNSSMVMRICRISSRSFRRSAGASGV
jgi:hypothetical protein